MTYSPKSRDEIRRNMSAIRSRDNRTETLLRKALFSRGLRYRKYNPKLIGKPDIAFMREKVAVFVDGDFWHARVLRENGPEALEERIKTRNRDYWWKKLHRRVERDNEVTQALEREGWEVIRLWESEVRADLERAAETIEKAVKSRRG